MEIVELVEGLVIALDRDDGSVLGSQLEEVVEKTACGGGRPDH